jgi:hypothetical protein
MTMQSIEYTTAYWVEIKAATNKKVVCEMNMKIWPKTA